MDDRARLSRAGARATIALTAWRCRSGITLSQFTGFRFRHLTGILPVKRAEDKLAEDEDDPRYLAMALTGQI